MPEEVQPGEVLGGYRLVEELGAGSTSRVFKAEHARLGRLAAVKVLSAEFVTDASVRARMFTEAKVVNDIRHPNIVDISDFVEQDEPARVALIMEYIPGPSLRRFRGAPLPFETALAVSRQLASALRAAHEQGVVHRDLKPDNVLLMSDPRTSDAPVVVKVVDFGIAKVAGPQNQAQTAFGTLLGTPAYMAPEQVASSPPPSSATDVYALAEIVYELVTGDRLFSLQKTEETVRQKLRGEHPEVKLPSGFEAMGEILTRSLSARPEQRVPIAQFCAFLDEFEPRRSSSTAPTGHIPGADTGAATQLAAAPETTRLGRVDEPEHATQLAVPDQKTEPQADLTAEALLGPAGLATGSSEFPKLPAGAIDATASSAALDVPEPLAEMPLLSGIQTPPSDGADDTQLSLPELEYETESDIDVSPADLFARGIESKPSAGQTGIALALVFLLLAVVALAAVLSL